MRVSESMTRDVIIANPRQTICEAACMMAKADAGSLPVGDGDRLVGFITDRDIALRAVAKSLPPETPVASVMSKEILYCFEDDDIAEVAKNMGDQQIRRLPVVNRDKRLVGIISLGDIANSAAASTAGRAVADISRAGGKHDQTQY